ncbi:disulfide bond formation protein B [Microvirga brassicacearum]|uniref:Disulfide bond formation protein B n=1 Tax=Microvirga brassicacearum TaxID=2580413 RepID=A0A5N3PHG5_9HYPH|nr:disulfide bond formation protein B [Microvirga brassicacearum]KAB0269168.1 disulfide bond formation protein B [Microvirga brassicacearum]
MRFPLNLRQASLTIALVAAATVGGALLFQHVWGYQPCKLCLQQRYPYYLGIPLALAGALLPRQWTRAGLYLMVLLFVASAALGAYHAGVEWGLWLGPSDCGGNVSTGPGNVGDLMSQLNSIRVVSCTEAAWRFLGLSLAGWNVLISLGIAGLAWSAARRG